MDMPQNVCVAFLGFDSDRIYLPVRKLKCHRLYLILRPEPERPNALYNARLILRALRGVRVEKWYVEDDLLTRVNCVKNIIDKERGNHIFINVSTGSKLDAVAGMLGIMLFGTDAATPFYAIPDDTGRYMKKNGGLVAKKSYSETKGLREIVKVPILAIQKPDALKLTALMLIKKHGGEVKKRTLVKELVQGGHLKGYCVRRILNKERICAPDDADGYRKAESSVFHFCENSIFRSLRSEWNAIEEDRKRKNKIVKLKPDGEKWAKIFFPPSVSQSQVDCA